MALVNTLLKVKPSHFRYISSEAGGEAKVISDSILDVAKSKKLGRYKYVCYVAIGNDTKQDLELASRCLWDTRKDDYACADYVTKDFYVVAILHAIYFE